MTSKFYVGIRNTGEREVFKCEHEPTFGNPRDSANVPYVCVIGPHKTRRGAEFMASPAALGNPHIRCAADADRIARTKRIAELEAENEALAHTVQMLREVRYEKLDDLIETIREA